MKDEILTLIIDSTKDNIPQLKNGNKMAILRANTIVLSSLVTDQSDVNLLLEKQDVVFIGILCTNNNIADPNDLSKTIDKSKTGDIVVEYERYAKIVANPLVLKNEKPLVVVRSLNEEKNGKTKCLTIGLLAYNRLTFAKTSIVNPKDFNEVIGKVEHGDFFVEEDKFLAMTQIPLKD